MAERLESVDRGTTEGPEGDREEVRSEGEEEEEGSPGMVDLTGSDDGEEESPAERLPRSEADGTSSGKVQNPQTARRPPNAGSLQPGSYEIMLCVDFIETTG